MPQKIDVSVACALPDDSFWQNMTISAGATARDAIVKSGVLEHFADLHLDQLDQLSIGIYAMPVKLDHILVDGDRVEIYRALLVDPKTVPRKAKSTNNAKKKI